MRHLWLLLLLLGCSAPARSGPIAQRAYVWQLEHTADVADAVRKRGPAFERLVVLAAEVDGDRVRHANIDWPALRAPIGLAIRLDKTLPDRSLVTNVLSRARAEVVELQIDYDCPDRKLDVYRSWLAGVREVIGRDMKLTITALPSWLEQDGVEALLAAVDGYMLQVHALEPPRSMRHVAPLCDVDKARRWIARAGELGRPFHLALPSYGYKLAFDDDGRFRGVVAEQDASPSAHERRVMADPRALSALVQSLEKERPRAMEGIVWFRLPVDGDRLSWSWRTMQAVMAGKPVAADIRVRARVDGPVVDVVIENAGDADGRLPDKIIVRHDGALVASDHGASFELEARGEDFVSWRPTAPGVLPAGDQAVVGWARIESGEVLHATMVR